MLTHNGRTASHPIDSIFLERWSPRAFTGEAISKADVATIFEAARWAPSSFNAQPWRFLYERRETPHWPSFLALLSESNQAWATKAAALIFIISKCTLRWPGSAADVPSSTHSFDTGAAWAHLALQATRLGWHAHGMAGFDKERAIAVLHVPDGYRIEAAAAIGRRGDPSSLSEKLRQREAPSSRQPLDDIAFEGTF